MKRILALGFLVVALAAVSGVSAGDAQALNPNQTTPSGVVNALYWDLDYFWGQPQREPGVGYYNYWANGQLVNYQASCDWTGDFIGSQGFYCPGTNIYFDWQQQSSNISTYGDGSTALWLAHEYGHHAQWTLGINWGQPYHELLADCFAGLYFRYGVNVSKKLVYNDYLEARNAIWRLSWNDPEHGTPDRRLKAFDYGFNRVGYQSCTTGWQYWS
jgi:predicted metalloprotease